MAQEASIFSNEKLSDLPLSEWLIENCKTMGMSTATKVQSETIPHILNGKNVVVRAKTGSGKTAAFALPILEHLSQDPYGIFAIILTPTRELACQIGDQFIALSANTGFSTAIAYGGSGYITNTGDIEDRPHILIATPGRLADLIKCGMDFDVSELKYLVIDEADQLLCNVNFNEALQTIIEPLPSHKDRQTLLFSATLDKSMKQIFNVLKCNENDIVFIETSKHKLCTTQNIKQTYCFVPEMTKETYLVTLCTELDDIKNKNKSVIIFISSKEYCMIMARLLKNFLLKVSELHANMKQKKRLNELMRFRSGKTNILVATDLASRGLDIPQVEYVINFDIPRSGFEYIHRIGRCGRIDRCGTSITFVSQYDIKLLKQIEKHIQSKMVEFKVDKFQSLVLKKMEKVLIVRAGIINSVETKYLMDPHGFKRHATLRWNGKFTDPRILGKVNLKKKMDTKETKKVIAGNKGLYNDFKNAFENEFDAEDIDGEQQEEEIREKRFYKQLAKKERKAGKKRKKMGDDIDDDRKDKMEEDESESDGEGIDANMHVIDEEVRLKNVEQIKQKRKMDQDKVGQDFHKLEGWQSFRYGKQGKKIKRMERMDRAKKLQMKRKQMEHKRSKREGRASELDLFSIYEKKGKKQGGVVRNNKNGNKWKSKKGIKGMMKKEKKKKFKKKKDNVKLSKSLRKKLSETEQQTLKNKKRAWFKGGDIEWE